SGPVSCAEVASEAQRDRGPGAPAARGPDPQCRNPDVLPPRRLAAIARVRDRLRIVVRPQARRERGTMFICRVVSMPARIIQSRDLRADELERGWEILPT